MEKLKIDWVDLTEIAYESYEIVKQENKDSNRNVRLVVESKVFTYADKTAMTVVIKNLITNVFKHCHSQYIVIKFGTIFRNGKKIFYIKDNGEGIPEEELKNIFNPNTVLNDSDAGQGMGLSITKDIIKNHNGEIWCESELGKGSTFYFTIN